jgi:peptidoglycan/xylan/chitin deacetylase (PgdA/CDA1 family)
MSKKEAVFIHVGANLVLVTIVAALLFGSLIGMGAVTAGGKNKAVYQGNTAEPRVSLMINVYWGTEYLDEMLRVLEAYDVKITFFLGGSWAAANSEIVLKMVQKGHELGNHGYSHKDHKKLSLKQNTDEIAVTGKLIQTLTGTAPLLFAPPSGSMGEAMFTACAELGYKVIMWSKDTVDWRDKDEDIVFKRATKNLQNGDLILMHPTAHTLKALPKILNHYKTSNFRAVTVSENLSPSNL